ncbi:MAG: DUF4214 domain-containing protein [Aquihabitans sp.]
MTKKRTVTRSAPTRWRASPSSARAALIIVVLCAAFAAPVGPGRPSPASAAVSPPACTTETVTTVSSPNCRMGYGGASYTFGTATLNSSTGFLEGRYTLVLPSRSSLCSDCPSASSDLATPRTYVPGAPSASPGAPAGLDFGMDTDQPDQVTTDGGTWTGKYWYHNPGGIERAVFIRAYLSLGGNDKPPVSAAADAVLQIGSTTPPPSCATGTTVLGTAPGAATVKVTPCPGETSIVSSYQALAYVGSSSTPTTVEAEGQYAEFLEDTSVLPNGRPVRFTTRAKGPNAVGPQSAKSAPAILPFTTVPGFTSQTFTDFAYRAPTAAEADAWNTALTNDTASGQALIAANVGTAAWDVRAPVIRLFRAYFGRLPDLGGLDYWVGKYRAGVKVSAISSNFAGSSEFKSKYGTLSNRAFVTRIYTDVLGRAADPSGVNYWTGKLDSKAKTRGQVMVGFSESSEYKNKTRSLVDVVTLYVAMIRAVPTQAQLDASITKTLVELANSLMSSTAYDKRFNTVAWPSITTATPLPTATKAKAFSFALAHYGGPPPLTWKVVSGKLPDGLTLSPGGVITGTPTKTGTFSFTIQLTDVRTRPTSKAFQLTVGTS